MSNYEVLKNGIIKQKKVNKINYDYNYSNKYNSYGEKGKNLSYLRLGILLGAIGKNPDSILDVGYGNGDFLKVAKASSIQNCYGCDISDYPVPENCKKVDLLDNSFYEVVCFFDSLEHFDDISFIEKLNCEYIFISVPWCHNFSYEWFQNWYHLRPNEHLWHFNDKSLVLFMKENGFEKIYLGNFEDIIRQNSSCNGNPNILSAIFQKIKG